MKQVAAGYNEYFKESTRIIQTARRNNINQFSTESYSLLLAFLTLYIQCAMCIFMHFRLYYQRDKRKM
jgi:hypothetical protein